MKSEMWNWKITTKDYLWNKVSFLMVKKEQAGEVQINFEDKVEQQQFSQHTDTYVSLI